MATVWTIITTAVGPVCVAGDHDGIHGIDLGREAGAFAQIAIRRWPGAIRDDAALPLPWLTAVELAAAGRPGRLPPLVLRGTPFQRRVWAALVEIPCGEVRTYGQVAIAIGSPTAVRAVAGACAANPVAILVPCHRVVAVNGLGGYSAGGGLGSKRALLSIEGCSAIPGI